MRYYAGLFALVVIVNSANAACVKPSGTYTGSFKGEYISLTEYEEMRWEVSGQMSLSVPQKGNWVSDVWADSCVSITSYDESGNKQSESEYCSDDSVSESAIQNTKLRNSQLVESTAQAIGWPGNGTKKNIFDTKTCRGIISVNSSFEISYIVSQNGDRLELLYGVPKNNKSIKWRNMFPIILNRS